MHVGKNLGLKKYTLMRNLFDACNRLVFYYPNKYLRESNNYFLEKSD